MLCCITTRSFQSSNDHESETDINVDKKKSEMVPLCDKISKETIDSSHKAHEFASDVFNNKDSDDCCTAEQKCCLITSATSGAMATVSLLAMALFPSAAPYIFPVFVATAGPSSACLTQGLPTPEN